MPGISLKPPATTCRFLFQAKPQYKGMLPVDLFFPHIPRHSIPRALRQRIQLRIPLSLLILPRILLRHRGSPATRQTRFRTIGGAVVRSPVGKCSGRWNTFIVPMVSKWTHIYIDTAAVPYRVAWAREYTPLCNLAFPFHFPPSTLEAKLERLRASMIS